MKRPLLAISMGDPGGIGPEVVVKALSDGAVRDGCRAVILGAGSSLARAAASAGIPCFWRTVSAVEAFDAGAPVVLVDEERGGHSFADGGYPAREDPRSGELSFKWVTDAIALAGLPAADPRHAHAVVTAPVSKHAWALAGHGRFPGHTELFADAFRSDRFAMFFHAPPAAAGPGLNVVLATVHIPLMKVREHLTVLRVMDVISLGHETMKRLGKATPCIAVCGLNPHAGEHGLLGADESEVIEPAIERSRRAGIDARGPFPADTIFQQALAWPGRPARFDLVVAMYHDQGLIPLKTLAWDRAVNMTVGLGIVRTSPDHGTAFDIAGRNLADPGSMRAAIGLAIAMTSP